MKKCVLRNFAKFTGKHLCQALLFNKVAGLRSATLLKKRFWHRCFLRMTVRSNSYYVTFQSIIVMNEYPIYSHLKTSGNLGFSYVFWGILFIHLCDFFYPLL